MIQRIQTVYLALAALILIMPVILPGGVVLATAETETGVYSLLADKVVYIEAGKMQTVSNPYGLIAAIMVAVFLSIYSIAQYKNRKFQMKLVQGALVVQLVIGVLVFVYADQMLALANSASVSYRPVLGALLVNVVLYFLAYRGIKKDDDLIRSADRLR